MTLLTAAAHFEHGPVSVTLYFRNAQIMGKRCVPGHTQCESPESNQPAKKEKLHFLCMVSQPSGLFCKKGNHSTEPNSII